MFFLKYQLTFQWKISIKSRKTKQNNRNAPLEATMNHPFISSAKPLFMNQLTPSQSRQGALSKSWCRFGKVAAITMAAAALASPMAEALVLQTNTVTIAPTGVLDLKTSNLIVHTGNFATLSGYIKTGLLNGTNGYWDGPGINSSSAAVDVSNRFGVGIVRNADAQYPVWPANGNPEGVPVALTDTLIKFTSWGDADLNGTTNGDDFTLFLDGFNLVAPSVEWLYGDFDYSGGVNGDDNTLFLLGFNTTGPVSPSLAAAIPEPTAISFVLVGVISALARRRRGGTVAN